MRKWLIVAAVLVQVGVLGWMAAEREWVLRSGKPMFLRTAPIDPQDPMRGDYVRLTYEIATVPKSLCRDGVTEWFSRHEDIYNSRVRDRRVYASVRLKAEDLVEIVALSDRPPTEGLYLRGRAQAIHLSTLEIRFGVEALFMQQGKARQFEQTVQTEKAGVPLNVEVAVGANGLAVIKGYRWEPLGITLTVDRDRDAARPQGTAPVRTGIRGVTIELKNHGVTPQAVVIAEGQTLRLIPAQERSRTEDPSGWVWVGENSLSGKVLESAVKLLQPGESHRIHLDLTAPEWFVRKVDASGSGQPTSLQTLVNDWTASFRVEYVPPSAGDSAALPHAELIRHVDLRSRRFGAMTGVD